eukprot:CAMPEP_0179054236 /NCGR_PEP_ID=MMETSP0796-20121207/22682_1 /TAXON_ID=73915 /ORGANISM="Pyrodinium bahamense, Strain pbaha01" /LENGTH=194 /DNA_ID=CAMNT_0020750853 /DNA_START=392 /DNA_END=977 /DNA_ORIENTATION=+
MSTASSLHRACQTRWHSSVCQVTQAGQQAVQGARAAEPCSERTPTGTERWQQAVQGAPAPQPSLERSATGTGKTSWCMALFNSSEVMALGCTDLESMCINTLRAACHCCPFSQAAMVAVVVVNQAISLRQERQHQPGFPPSAAPAKAVSDCLYTTLTPSVSPSPPPSASRAAKAWASATSEAASGSPVESEDMF